MPPVLPSLVWALLCLVMWFWAVIGPLFVVFGAASYFMDMRDVLSIPGQEALSFGGVVGAVGISFVWLHMRGHIRFEERSRAPNGKQ